jgi:hypothetical protein
VQEAVDGPVLERVQIAELKLPGPLLLQPTVPVGVIAVPGDVSATVAVQVTGCLAWVVLGEQLTLVEVLRFVTDIVV